jgi:hypothetical protein
MAADLSALSGVMLTGGTGTLGGQYRYQYGTTSTQVESLEKVIAVKTK